MWFDPKDFETLHRFKIRNSFDDSHISNHYFICVENKMMFIKKSRRYYKIVASTQCGFEPIYRESCLDVIYHDTDLTKTISMFYGYCIRLINIGVILNGVYQSDICKSKD